MEKFYIKTSSRLKQDTVVTGDPSSSAMVGAQGGRPWKPSCYSCGQTGHLRWDCLKRKEYIKPQHKGFNTSEGSIPNFESPDNVGAFAASVRSTSDQMDKWLIDSGVSSHMTWEKNILTN